MSHRMYHRISLATVPGVGRVSSLLSLTSTSSIFFLLTRPPFHAVSLPAPFAAVSAHCSVRRLHFIYLCLLSVTLTCFSFVVKHYQTKFRHFFSLAPILLSGTLILNLCICSCHFHYYYFITILFMTRAAVYYVYMYIFFYDNIK